MSPVSLVPIVVVLHVLGAGAVFLIRPFLKGPIKIETPKHNFWPYVPVTMPPRGPNVTDFFQKPDHNFWPFVPMKSPVDGNATYRYFDVPRHNFWPFIPIEPPGNRTKPLPPTPPPPTLPPPDKSYDYGEVLFKSILFYEAQRSGWLPVHRKVTWRGHSALEDKGEREENLSGGWYDAGDYVKFGLPMAGATTMLLLGLVEFEEAYRAVNLLDDMYDCVRWPLDYFTKAHPSKYEFYAMVADPYVDHSYWGRPEDMNMYRPSYKLSPEAPGSDVIGETAAAMAAGSVAFKDVDKEYSDLLLRHARELFDFADRYRGLYSDSLPIVQEFYSSSGYKDELAWAAAWLFKATGDNRYLQKAEELYESRECWAVSWDAKDCLAALLLYKLTNKTRYRYDIQRTMRAWMPGGSVDYTPGGLAFRTPWGPLRYTANMATLALAAANAGIEPVAYRRWARAQINYMLGDSGRSFVVGFGHNPPTRPHHAASSCPPAPTPCTWAAYTTPEPNPIILYGALVGGPSADDSFQDYRGDYYQSEVTCDYNAGFQSALAGLLQLETHRRELEKLGQLSRRPNHNVDLQKNFKEGIIPWNQENPDKRRPFRQSTWRNSQGWPNLQQQQQNELSVPNIYQQQNPYRQQHIYVRQNDGNLAQPRLHTESMVTQPRSHTDPGKITSWWDQRDIRKAFLQRSRVPDEAFRQSVFSARLAPRQGQRGWESAEHDSGGHESSAHSAWTTMARTRQVNPYPHTDYPHKSPVSPQRGFRQRERSRTSPQAVPVPSPFSPFPWREERGSGTAAHGHAWPSTRIPWPHSQQPVPASSFSNADRK